MLQSTVAALAGQAVVPVDRVAVVARYRGTTTLSSSTSSEDCLVKRFLGGIIRTAINFVGRSRPDSCVAAEARIANLGLGFDIDGSKLHIYRTVDMGCTPDGRRTRRSRVTGYAYAVLIVDVLAGGRGINSVVVADVAADDGRLVRIAVCRRLGGRTVVSILATHAVKDVIIVDADCVRRVGR